MTKRKTIDEFREEVKQVWGNRYTIPSYSTYTNTHSKVIVNCKIHGDFEIEAKSLLHGHGCKKCANELKHKNGLLSNEEVLRRLEEKLGNRYLLDKVQYYNARTKILLGCRKHGYFPIKFHDAFNLHGCPHCQQSRAEALLNEELKKNNIEFKTQFSFEWMKTSTYGKLSCDFYLPKQNIAIECQGRQHFEVVEAFGGDITLKKTIERDNLKKKLCKENDVKLIYYLDERFNECMKDGDVYFNDMNDLMEYIKKYGGT